MPPGHLQRWYTEAEGKRFPVCELIRAAGNGLRMRAPSVIGPTSHEAVAVLSHNGITSHNMAWD